MQRAGRRVNKRPSGKPSSDLFIVVSNDDPGKARSKNIRALVRSQAARSSAAARQATIASRATQRYGRGTRPCLQYLDTSSTDSSPQSSPLSDSPTTEPSTVFLCPQNGFVQPHPGCLSTSPLGMGRIDPFQTYPVGDVWHESIPALVDVYLTCIAPPAHPSLSHCGRAKLRQRLWPEILSSGALFFSNLLIAAVQISIRQNTRPERDLLDWLHQMAVQSISNTLNNADVSRPTDAVIGATSVMAAYEIEYGSHANYETHMNGLSAMLRMRADIDGGDTISPTIMDLVWTAAHDSPLFAGKQPSLVPDMLKGRVLDVVPSSSLLLPPGLQVLVRQSLLPPSILRLASQVYTFDQSATNALEELLSIQHGLVEHRTTDFLALDYCPVQTARDDAINFQAIDHIRLAALCLVHRYSLTLYKAHDSDIQHARNHVWLQHQASLLEPDLLVCTVYAEVCIWSLFTIHSTVTLASATQDYARELTLLKLINGIRASDWAQIRSCLFGFIYDARELEQPCEELWARIQGQHAGAGWNSPCGSPRPSRYDTLLFSPPAGLVSGGMF